MCSPDEPSVRDHRVVFVFHCYRVWSEPGDPLHQCRPGDSIIVKGPDGTTVLLEAGNTGMGTSRVVPYLQSIGIQPANGLDYMIGGHQHCDHIGGLDEVINAGYDVGIQSYYNGSSYQSSCVTSWNAAAAGTTAAARVVPTVGSQIPLGNGAHWFSSP